MAGGLTEEADIKNVNLAYVLEDAMKIHIPSILEEDDNVSIVSSENGKSNNLNQTMVNLNTASLEELQKLDGIGESIALRIVTYRKENGKFNSIEDLKSVPGIGNNKYEGIKNNVFVK